MRAPSALAEGAPTAEIVAIGNELLLGIVHDTNAHWLCSRITERGGAVRRATVIPDDERAIGETLTRALDAERTLIVLTGGLGPTEDDMTLAALARALDRPLLDHEQALAMIERRYRELAHDADVEAVGTRELTPSRRKMARLPEGATPLFNPVGTAPGVLLGQGSSTVVALPGVPSELQGIWADSLRPHLEGIFADSTYAERHFAVDMSDESGLAPLLSELQRAWPQVYVKSRPQGDEENRIVRITLAMGGERATVASTLDEAAEALRARLDGAGYPVREEPGSDGA